LIYNFLGNFYTESTKRFDFSDANIAKLNKMAEKHLAKISPSYFSKICGTTGLLIFLVKDALEYAGVIIDPKRSLPARILKNLTYPLENLRRIKRKYIDFLK
jgi:hypothetical protein